MTITSATSANATMFSSTGSTTVAQLEKQLQTLEKSLTDENQSTDSTQTKAAKVKLIEQEIQQVQMEIQQAQTRAAQKSAQNNGTGQTGASATDTKQAKSKTQGGSDQILNTTA